MPGEAWVPAALEGLVDASRLAEGWSYVVVDEIVGNRVGLAIAPWPRVDDAGRLEFADPEDDQLVGVARHGLQELLRERRVPLAKPAPPPSPETARALVEREVRIGDVYAIPRAAAGEWTDDDGRGNPRLAVPAGAEIYDVTYDARNAARLAAAAAVAPPLDEQEADRFLREDSEIEG